MLGFSSSAALYIASTQLSNLFSMHDCHRGFFERTIYIITNLDQTLLSLTLGITGIVVLLAGEHFLPKLPWPLIVVLLSILSIGFTGLGDFAIEIAGKISQGLPHFEIPSLSLVQIRQLLPTALAVFFLACVEGMGIACSFHPRSPSNKRYTIAKCKEPSEIESSSYPNIFNYRRERRESYAHPYRLGSIRA